MITKRQLGFIFIALGVVALAALFVMDWLGASGYRGIGPAQAAGLVGIGLLILVGLTLLPLGDRPA
jgi:hypothetical protein